MAIWFRADTVTVPVPADLNPDTEQERFLSSGNISWERSPLTTSRPLQNKTVIQQSEPLYTPDENGHVTIEQQQLWMQMSQGVLYYAFPIEICWGIISGFISLIVIARQRKTSNDSYLIGFTVATILLLICGGILKLQDYMPHDNEYQKIYGYIKSANDWLWYTALWVLCIMTVERSLTLIQNRNKSFCSAVQASIIIIMIFCVCLISALPEFWEYEAIETFDFASNKTFIMSHISETADSPEYKIMYFWYSVSITVFLPYPTMIVMIFALTQGMRRQSRHSKKRLSLQKHSSSKILNRRISEEMHLTRMYIVMILLYLLLTAPLTFLIIVNGITPHWSWPEDKLYNGLYVIFEFVFYFYFSIQFPLYLSYYDKFRHSFLSVCCCCCSSCRQSDTKLREYSTDSLRRHSESLHRQQSDPLCQEPSDPFHYKLASNTLHKQAESLRRQTESSHRKAESSRRQAESLRKQAGPSCIQAGTSYMPAGTSYIPAGTSYIPAGTSYIKAGSSCIQEESLYEPNESLYRKEKSLHMKDESLHRLDESLYRPDESLYRPDQSLYRPDESLYRPDESLYRPDQSLYRPDETLYRKEKTLYIKDDSLYRKDDSLYRKDETLRKHKPKPHNQQSAESLHRQQSQSLYMYR